MYILYNYNVHTVSCIWHILTLEVWFNKFKLVVNFNVAYAYMYMVLLCVHAAWLFYIMYNVHVHACNYNFIYRSEEHASIFVWRLYSVCYMNRVSCASFLLLTLLLPSQGELGLSGAQTILSDVVCGCGFPNLITCTYSYLPFTDLIMIINLQYYTSEIAKSLILSKISNLFVQWSLIDRHFKND